MFQPINHQKQLCGFNFVNGGVIIAVTWVETHTIPMMQKSSSLPLFMGEIPLPSGKRLQFAIEAMAQSK